MVRDGLEDSLEGPGRVGGPSERSGTGLRTIGEVRDVSGEPGKVREWSGNLGEVLKGSEDPRGGLGRVWGTSGKSGQGRSTFD